MLSGEIHPASRVQASILEVRLVAEGVLGHSITNLEPLLVAVLIAGGSVTLLEIVHYPPRLLKSDIYLICIGV